MPLQLGPKPTINVYRIDLSTHDQRLVNIPTYDLQTFRPTTYRLSTY